MQINANYATYTMQVVSAPNIGAVFFLQTCWVDVLFIVVLRLVNNASNPTEYKASVCSCDFL